MMEKLRDIRAVVCDWDDTKVDTFDSVYQIWKDFCDLTGQICANREEFIGHWGKPLSKMIKDAWEVDDGDTWEKTYFDFVDSTDFCIKPFDYTKKTVLELKDRGYVLSVVSSGPRKSMFKTIDRYLGFPRDLYLNIHAGEDSIEHKPNPRVFDKTFECLKKLNISEEQSIYVGDSINDYLAARDRGMLFAAVTTGFTSREDFLGAGLPKENILDSFAHLPNFLENYS